MRQFARELTDSVALPKESGLGHSFSEAFEKSLQPGSTLHQSTEKQTSGLVEQGVLPHCDLLDKSRMTTQAIAQESSEHSSPSLKELINGGAVRSFTEEDLKINDPIEQAKKDIQDYFDRQPVQNDDKSNSASTNADESELGIFEWLVPDPVERFLGWRK